MDDWSKARQRGISDRVKVIWQIAVGLTFAVAFWLYATGRFVPLDETTEWGRLTLPYGGPVALGSLYVPVLFVFLIAVSNSVNFTDGFNGLAGGVAALVALAYTVLTFAIGAQEPDTAQHITPVAQRMFALAVMSAAISGGVLGFLFYNYGRAAIFMGDTGSMSLGAALTFLAVFSQTEFLFLIIAGVFFIEGLSAALQRGWAAVLERVLAASLIQRMEVSRPFIIAPLHHHFETLALRELEGTGQDLTLARQRIRRRLTHMAWGLGAILGVVGLLAHFVNYDLFWSVGVLLGVAVLIGSIITRFLQDCYFIGTSEEEGRGRKGTEGDGRGRKGAEGTEGDTETPRHPDTHSATSGTSKLTLYRGVPLEIGRRRFYHVYEETAIPLADLSLLNQQAVLYRPLYSRVDARLLFGLLYFDRAAHSPATEQPAWQRGALNFWEKIPPERLMIKQRHVVLLHMAACYETLQRYADAIRTLDHVPDPYRTEAGVAQRIDAIQNESWQVAEQLYQRGSVLLQPDTQAPVLSDDEQDLLQRTLAAHCELCAILDHRRARNRDFRAQLIASGNPRSGIRDPGEARAAEATHLAAIEDRLVAIDAEAERVEQATRIIRARCERLRQRLGQSSREADCPDQRRSNQKF
jgi:UDP-N-acetylmuramyl pentapeptide phosphotransferase/UDP-N-acetylglucosamine-1-phosphate transferase